MLNIAHLTFNDPAPGLERQAAAQLAGAFVTPLAHPIRHPYYYNEPVAS